MGIWLVGEFREFYLQEVKQGLVRQTVLAEVIMRDRIGEGNLDNLARSLSVSANARATFIAPNGVVIGESERDASSLDNHLGRPEIQAALAGEAGINIRSSPTLGVPMLYAAVPSRDSAGAITAVVRLALDISSVNTAFARIRFFVLTGGFIALIVGSILAVVNAQAVSEPLQEMAAVARRLASGDLSSRVVQAGPFEAEQLAQSLNTMAQNLEREFRRVQVSTEKLEAVLSSMRDAVILIDKDERIELMNKAAEEMLGLKVEAVVGLQDAVLERYPELAYQLRDARVEQTASIRRIALGPSSGRQLRAAVLPLDSGRILLTMQDLTEVYRAMDMRKDFVANVSHELRTPLTSLGLMVENLQRGALKDHKVAEDFLSRMSQEIERLTKMVVELLQLSRLEGGLETPLKSQFPALSLVSEVVENMAELLKAKEQTVTLEGDVGISIFADRVRLRQVLINLIDNASKFSPDKSTITLGLNNHRHEDELYVRDEGPGIPPAHVPRVYERFFKGSSSRGGGTGLGLAIVKHIVESHGGSVYVHSRLGEGATFGFYLPTQEQRADSQQ